MTRHILDYFAALFWHTNENEGYELYTYVYDYGILQWQSHRMIDPVHHFVPPPNVYASSNVLDTPDISKLCYGGPIPGPYLCADNCGAPYSGHPYPTIAPARGIVYKVAGSWECFNMVSCGQDGQGRYKYAFRTLSGWYLSAVNNGGGDVCTGYQNQNIGAWETFTAIPQADGYIAWLCGDGSHYLRYETGYADYPISARSTSIDVGEKFGMEKWFETQDGKYYFIRARNCASYGPEFNNPPALHGVPL